MDNLDTLEDEFSSLPDEVQETTSASSLSLDDEFASMPDESNTLLEESIKAGMNKNPDAYANQLKQSRRHGLPMSIVEDSPERVNQLDKLAEIDPQRLKHATPGLVKFLSNPQNAAAMHDQISALEEIEKIMGVERDGLTKGLGTTLLESTKQGFTSSKLWFNQEMRDELADGKPSIKDSLSLLYILGRSKIHPDAHDIPAQKAKLKEHERIIQENTPKNLTPTEKGIRGGIESLAQMAPLMAASVISKSSAPMFAGMGYQVGADSYAKGITGGLTHDEATRYASIDAAIEMGTEYGPAKLTAGMFKDMGKKKFSTFIKKFAFQEIAGEQLATLGQSANAYAFKLDEELRDPNKSLSDKVAIQAERQYVTAVATVVAGGAQSGAVGAINYGLRDKQKADDVENKAVQKEFKDQSEQDQLDTITELSQGLRDRDTELTQEYFETLQEEYGLEDQVYISPDSFQDALETGEYDLDSDVIDKVNNMARIAGATGQDVAIPLSEYMTHFANDTNIRQNVRLSTDGLSLSELSEAPAVRDNIVKRMVEEAKVHVEKKDEADAIWNEVTEQLVDTGKMNSRVARTQASIIPAYVVTKAERTGKSVTEVYADLGVMIESGDKTGVSLEQSSETIDDLQKRLVEELPLKSLRMSESDKITLSDIEVEDTQRSNGVGSQVIQEITKYADSVGKRIELTPDKKEGAGTTSVSRLKTFYKTNGFIENKGKNKDFEISESMYREPQKPSKSRGVSLDQSEIQTESKEFKQWANTDSEVIEGYEINDTDFSGNGPFVLKGYHGTTHDFNVFDTSNTGSKEGHFGQVNYFTSSEYDADTNYAGEGPDLTNRIERRKEELEDDFDTEEAAYAQARSELSGGEGQVLEVFLRTEKPFVVGDGAPFREFVDLDQMQTDAIQEVADNNDIEVSEVEENIEDYEDQIDEARWNFEAETENELVEAMQTVAYRYDFDASEILAELYEITSEGGYTNAIEEMMREKLNEAYIEDPETGDLIASHVLAEVVQELGYDSIILKDADQQFENMDMERGTSHIHVFDENNTNIKSATDNKGTFDPADPNILNQQQRGSIEMQPDNKRVIRLSESADLSTFLHESGHLFLEMEKQYAKLNGVTEDQQAILDYLEVDSFDQLDPNTDKGRDAHEKFAESFENYLMEGKAPSASLREAFRSFKRWLTQLYKTITAYPDVQLTREIRDVFDRMLATDVEIQAAQAEYGPVVVSENSTEKASEDLLSKVLKQLRSKTEKWWKEEFDGEYQDALSELEDSKVYKAEEYLRDNKVDTQQAGESLGYLEPKRSKNLDPKQDSLVVAIGKLGGINRAEAEAQGIDPAIWQGKRNVNLSYGPGKNPFRKDAGDSFDGMAENLSQYGYMNGIESHDPNSLLEAVTDELNGFESFSNQYEPTFDDGIELTTKPRRLYGTTKKDGLDIEFAAKQNGYVSGDAMLSDIADSKEIKIAAKELANEKMIEKHGDILRDGTLEEEARIAVNNDEKGSKLLAELRAVNPKNKIPTGINRDMLKRAAQEAIANMPIKQLNGSVESYHRKEVKAAQEFERLKTEGDLDGATQAKMDQLLNFYLFRESRTMREKVERWREYAQGVKTRKYSASQVDPEYINHMKKYSSAFDFRKSPTPQSLDNLKSLANWINSQNETNPEGYAPQFYDPVLAKLADPNTRLEDVQINNWKEMTVNDLQSVKEQLEHLRFIGGKLSESSKEQRAAIVEEVAQSVIANGGKSKPKTRNGRKRSIADKIAGFGYSQLRAYMNIEEMDGFRDDPANGAMYKHIWQQVLDASDTNVALKLEVAEKVKFFLNPNKETRNRLSDKTLKTFSTMSGEISLTPMERVMFAVYWGSPESRATLMETGAEGKPLTAEEAQTILDSLTDTDIKVVQGIWETNESLRSRMFATERKVNGIAPKAVDAAPFSIRGNYLPGGYQKIKYERSSKDEVGREDPMSEAMNKIMGSGISTTKAGSMNERVGSGGRELSLNLSNVTSALDESIQFISFAEVSRDVSRIIRNPELKEALEDKYGAPRLNSFIDALNSAFVGDVANGHGADAIADMARTARSNMSMAMLMFSVRNVVQQVVGSTNVLSKTGIVDYSKAATDFIGDTNYWVEFVESRSNMMKYRMKLTNREVTESANSLQASATNSWLKDHGYIAQTAIDKAIGMPGWLSAYRKGLSIYATSADPDKRASQYADEIVVSTLGSGQIKDLAPMFSGASQKGNPLATEFLKQLTFMGSFFNIVGGLYYRSYKTNDLKSVSGFANFQKDLMWTLYLPAILSALIVDDIPDEEPWGEWIAKKITGYGFGSMMGVRDVVGYFNEGFAPSLPVSNTLKAAGNLIKTGHGLASGEKEFTDEKLVPNLIRDLSPFIGAPGAYQVSRMIKGANDEDQDIYGSLVEGTERNK